MHSDDAEPHTPSSRGRLRVAVALVAVVLVVGGIAVGKNLLNRGGSTPSGVAATAESSEATTSAQSSAKTAQGITSQKNDFAADYEDALASGKPVFVYFHTTTCPSCKAFSPMIEKVMPDYQGKVVFVNALEDYSEAAYDLASRHGFEYVPTSLFLSHGGAEDSSFVGPMTENELRRQLSTMASGQ